jgi:hypothetical protein
MTIWDLIIALFYHVDEQLHDIPKHPEAHLWPSEVVTLGLLHARNGGGNRPSIAGSHATTACCSPASPSGRDSFGSSEPIRTGRKSSWPLELPLDCRRHIVSAGEPVWPGGGVGLCHGQCRRENPSIIPLSRQMPQPILLLALLDCSTLWQSWRNSRRRPSKRKVLYVNPHPSPPPVGHRKLLVLWERLPPANRQRLLWLLSQLLEHQLHASVAWGEDDDESASRP